MHSLEGIPEVGNEEEIGSVRLTRAVSWEGTGQERLPHPPASLWLKKEEHEPLNGCQLLPELSARKALHNEVSTFSPITPAMLPTLGTTAYRAW